MKIIIGLGNPWEKYQKNRHNVGFLFVEYFRRSQNFPNWKDSNFEALISEGSSNWEKIILVKPLTFMNLSGNSIQKITAYYKLTAEDILVISDDIDMEFSKIRYREKWSHGGQNGLRDIIAKLWTDAFSRIKIGVWRDSRMSVADWVLSNFSRDEINTLEEVIFVEAEKKVIENFIF